MNQKFKKLLFLPVLCAALMSTPSHGEVALYDQNNWKVGLSGFVELDAFFDSTRSLTEVVGNNPVARPGTLNGDNGRLQMSMRNTRFAFNVVAPVSDDWKTRGYLEMDFLGYDPAVSATQSESAFYTNPSLRIRHAYLQAEKSGWQILAGQNWTLFGWQPQYVLATVSVAPVSGTLYQRSPRVGVIKTIALDETNDLQTGISLQRPTQRDSEIPNIDLGVRWADSGRKAGFAGANSDIKAQPLSIALSGTFRQFEYPRTGGATNELVRVPAFGLAIDALVPIIASSDGKDPSHTLSFTGEFTTGRGYGDEFTGFGSIAGIAATGAAPNNVNLDPGLGGYGADGGFDLVQLRTWNAELQYHFVQGTFTTVGYGQLSSDNAGGFVNAGSSGIYDRSETYFFNLVHDFTSNVRLGLEFDQFATHYADGVSVHDNRYLLASYFRF